MLKSNSKKAVDNIRAYIMDGFNGENYNIEKPDTFKETAKIVYNTFKSEKYYPDSYEMKMHITEQVAFVDWLSGLPSIIDACFWYNRSAVDDLGALLEETDSEKAKYSEAEAEKMLSYLIYREIKKGVR